MGNLTTDIYANIPIPVLIDIAVYGEHGTGELCKMTQLWAEKLLIQNNYSDELKKARQKQIQEQIQNIKNTCGEEVAGKLVNVVSTFKNAVEKAIAKKTNNAIGKLTESEEG